MQIAKHHLKEVKIFRATIRYPGNEIYYYIIANQFKVYSFKDKKISTRAPLPFPIVRTKLANDKHMQDKELRSVSRLRSDLEHYCNDLAEFLKN